MYAPRYPVEYFQIRILPDVGKKSLIHKQELHRAIEDEQCIRVNLKNWDNDALKFVIELDCPPRPLLLYEPRSRTNCSPMDMDCLMARFRPSVEFNGVTGDDCSDIVFILEGSGLGPVLDHAKACMDFMITCLKQGQRFQIVRASAKPSPLFSRWVSVAEPTIHKARAYIRIMQHVNSNDVRGAVRYICTKYRFRDHAKLNVILVGRGLLGSLQGLNLPEEYSARTRISVISLDCPFDVRPMSELAAQSGGKVVVISDSENMEPKLRKFFNDISQPCVTDVKVVWKLFEGLTDDEKPKECIPVRTIPERMNTLFHDTFVTVYALFQPVDVAKLSGHVILEYKVGDACQESVIIVREVVQQVSPEACQEMALHHLATDASSIRP